MSGSGSNLFATILAGLVGVLGGSMWSDYRWGKELRMRAERGETLYADGKAIYVPDQRLREGAARGETIYADGQPIYKPATPSAPSSPTITRGRGEYGR